MALIKTLALANGLVAVDAYHKLAELEIRSFGATAQAILRVFTYLNEAMADAAAEFIVVRSYVVEDFDRTASLSAHAQVYAYLKTLDDFIDAIDA